VKTPKSFLQSAVREEQGLTLIELLIVIVVSGIFIAGVAGAFLNLVNQGTVPEDVVQANYLGQQKMEELTENPFPNVTIQEQSYTASGVADFEWYWKVEYIDGTSLAPSAGATNYKQITVKVRKSGGAELSYATIITKRYHDSPIG
jgi:prepilin-type N-terminal cleavage/methylation domain-containing protein